MSNFVTYNSVSPTFYAFLISLFNASIPKTVVEVLSHQGWRPSMEEEMFVLVQNDTRSLVSPPVGNSIVSCRWVFIMKIGPTGLINRLKVKLIAKGFTQV